MQCPVRNRGLSQLLKPVLCNGRSHRSETPTHCNEEWPPLTSTRDGPRAATKTQCSLKEINLLKKRIEGFQLPTLNFMQFIGKIRWHILNIQRIDVEGKKILDSGGKMITFLFPCHPICLKLLGQYSWGLLLLELQYNESRGASCEHSRNTPYYLESLPSSKG